MDHREPEDVQALVRAGAAVEIRSAIGRRKPKDGEVPARADAVVWLLPAADRPEPKDGEVPARADAVVWLLPAAAPAEAGVRALRVAARRGEGRSVLQPADAQAELRSGAGRSDRRDEPFSASAAPAENPGVALEPAVARAETGEKTVLRAETRPVGRRPVARRAEELLEVQQEDAQAEYPPAADR